MNKILLILAVIFGIVGFSTHLFIFSLPVYSQLHDAHDSAPGSTAFSADIISFFLEETPLPPGLDERELIHMHDVRNITQVFFMLYVASILLILYQIRQDARTVIHPALIGSGIVLSTIGLIAVIPFDTTFKLFHQLLFAEGTWLFATSSPLIQAYPFAFFASFAQLIAIAAASISVTTLIICTYMLKKSSTTTILK